MSAAQQMNEWGYCAPTREDRERFRLASRVRYLPTAIANTEEKLARLKQEAARIGLDVPKLERSHLNGDQIATEYLKRLGYFR